MYHIFPSYHYYEHPTDPNYLIFTFRRMDMANHFESELKRLNIKFKSDTDVTPREVVLFHYAVLQSDRDAVVELFYTTWGKFRKPFINGTIFKVVLSVLSITLITLAIIGYFKQ